MTSKEQERKALEQIRKIVEGLGADSYVGAAFTGCFEDAEENITNDFALCWKDRAESAGKRLEECSEEIKRKDAKIEGMTTVLKELQDHNGLLLKDRDEERGLAMQRADEIMAQAREITALRDELEEKEHEIIKLKARLYDCMINN